MLKGKTVLYFTSETMKNSVWLLLSLFVLEGLLILFAFLFYYGSARVSSPLQLSKQRSVPVIRSLGSNLVRVRANQYRQVFANSSLMALFTVHDPKITYSDINIDECCLSMGIRPSNVTAIHFYLPASLPSPFTRQMFVEAAQQTHDLTHYPMSILQLATMEWTSFSWNGFNQVGFGNLQIPGHENALAVTMDISVCPLPLISGNCPVKADLIGFKMFYDVVGVPWSASGDPNSYDCLATVCHESMHATACWNDVYDVACQSCRMYGIGRKGDISKRQIGVCDRQCVNRIEFNSNKCCKKASMSSAIVFGILIILLS